MNGVQHHGAAGNRRRQNQHMAVADQMRDVAAEDQLMPAVQLRRDDIDRLVLIRDADPAFDQLLRQKGRDDLGPLQAENAVDRRGFVQVFRQFLRCFLRFLQTVLTS